MSQLHQMAFNTNCVFRRIQSQAVVTRWVRTMQKSAD